MSAQRGIAVIIPVYNREKYVGEALESVAAQTRQPDEVIVVDDGSTDRSVDIVEHWRGTHDLPLRLIRQANAGAAAARNTAIRAADADLIAPLDSDDVWLPDHLKMLEEAIQRYPYLAASIGNSGRLDRLPLGKTIGFTEDVFATLPVYEQSETLRVYDRSAMFLSLLRGAWIPMCSSLFGREAAIRAGLFDESFRTHEDQDFWVRMSRQGPFAVSNECLSLVRKHDDNLTHRRNRATFILCGLRVLEKTILQAPQLRLTSEELAAARQALAQYADRALRSASRYGMSTFLIICLELLSRGYWRPLLQPRAIARALLRPRGVHRRRLSATGNNSHISAVPTRTT